MIAPGPAPAPAPAPAPRGSLRVGNLAAGDKQLETGEYYDDHTIQAADGEEIIAIVTSTAFDPFLILIQPSGDNIENDDFGGSTDVALIEIPIETPGTYTLRITSYEPGDTGEYALMASTREADGNDAGGDMGEYEAEEFDVKGPITIGTPISGTLGADDPERSDGSYYEAYTFQGQEGQDVVITLTSKDFDAYLTLVSPSGETEQNDDQDGGGTDSKIETTLGESGAWQVVANTLSEGETGNYRLTVRRE